MLIDEDGMTKDIIIVEVVVAAKVYESPQSFLISLLLGRWDIIKCCLVAMCVVNSHMLLVKSH